MLPSLSPVASSSSATVMVDKATSELLMAPDWTLNIEICDAINSDRWLAKDVVKALKKRLQHRSPRVQLLAVTLLETMVKNCGDHIHFHIAEKKILDELIKLVKKRADMQVRDKILVLLDSWQEAFGGPGGKHPQYYWAYDELRRFGVQFPPRTYDSAPIFTPPVSHPPSRQTQASLGMPINSSTRLDEAMAAEVEELSVSNMASMRNVMELLSDMLQAVIPEDRMAVKDEVIVDLVDRCRANQKKLMQMLTTTNDEGLLAQGLELNDALQSVLAKHDAIATGKPLLTNGTDIKFQSNQLPEPRPTSNEEAYMSKAEGKRQAVEEEPVAENLALVPIQEYEEEEDDGFAELARRHSKAPPVASDDSSTPSNALALPDPPAPVKTSKEQELIDFLSIVLSTSTTSPEAPQTPTPPPQCQTPVSPVHDSYTPPGNYSGNHSQPTFSSYVVPWAQPQQQMQQPYSQPTQMQQVGYFQPTQMQLRGYSQQAQMQQPSYSQYTSAYPPPPWASSSGYGSNQNLASTNQFTYQQPGSFQNPQFSQGVQSLQHTNSFKNPQTPNQQVYPTSQTTNPDIAATQGVKSLQPMKSFPARKSDAPAVNGDAQPSTSTGQKPYVPSYRLFEDLNVLEGKLKSGPYPSSSSNNPGQSMINGRQ
ncbi:hypothetical protein Drorol1_Dr00008993 [Drosera rotundifolia]